MSLWSKVDDTRIAALAARDAYWRIVERHKSRLARGDNSLAGEKMAAADRMWAAEVEYNTAVVAALSSGEQRPEDGDGC